MVGDRTLPLRPGCCSLSKVERKKDAGRVLGAYEPTLLADGSHMEGGSTRDWGFEDIVIADGKVFKLLELSHYWYRLTGYCVI